MNEELTLEKLADLAVHYPEYLIDAAAEHFNGDECKLEAIAVVVSGLNDLYMPSSTLLFIRVLSKMLDMEVELPAELMTTRISAHGLCVNSPIGCFGMWMTTANCRRMSERLGAHIHSCLIQTA